MVHFRQSNGSGQDNTYFTSNSLTNGPPDWSSRVLGKLWKYIDTKICGTNAYILGSRNIPRTFPSLSRNYVRVFGIVTGSRDWRSKAQYKFSQHYSTISARSLGIRSQHPSWQTTSSMAVPWQFHDSSRILPGHCYGAKLDPPNHMPSRSAWIIS